MFCEEGVRPLLYVSREAFELEDLYSSVRVDVVEEARYVEHEEGGSVSGGPGSLDLVY